MSQIFMNEQSIKFSYQDSQPISPLTQLMYILPKDSLGLFPEYIKNRIIADDSKIKHNYPEDYDIIPFDKHKEYTWLAEIEDIKDEEIQEFLTTIDWNQLTDIEKHRNARGKMIMYKYSHNAQLVTIEPTISGIEPIKYNIQIDKFELEDKYPFKGFANEPVSIQATKRQFPSFKLYKHLKLKKVMKNARYTNFIVLTNQTINDLYSSFENSYKKVAEIKKARVKTVYLDHLFGKNLRVAGHGTINADSREFEDIVKQFMNVCRKNFTIIENINNIYNFPQIRVFDLVNPIFAHLDFDKNLYPYMHFRTGDDTIRGTFLDLTIKKMFPALKTYETKFDDSYFADSFALSLYTGHHYMMKTDQTNKQMNYIPSLQKMNKFVGNVLIGNSDEKLLLIKQDLLKKLNLELKHLPLLWIVMDSLRVTTLAKNHSSLILGDIFDIGLNFFHILNKNHHNWRTVNDMVRIFHIKDKDRHSCSFEYDDKKQIKYYDICLTREGYNALMSYFIENKEVITYLKEQEIYVYDKEFRRFMYRNKFSGRDMLYDFHKKGDDVNIIIFQIYSNILRKEHSSLQLHSSLSLNYSIETIAKKLLKFNYAENNDELYDEKSYMFLMKYSRFKECVWPALNNKPSYHELGDRVIFINNYDTDIMYGALGIITGIYNNRIEILFDEPFIGANNLNGRCPHFRGAVKNLFDVFNLTRWSQSIVTSESSKKYKSNIWDGSFDVSGLIQLIKSNHRKLEEKRNIVLDM